MIAKTLMRQLTISGRTKGWKKAEAHMGIGLNSRMIVTPSKNRRP